MTAKIGEMMPSQFLRSTCKIAELPRIAILMRGGGEAVYVNAVFFGKLEQNPLLHRDLGGPSRHLHTMHSTQTTQLKGYAGMLKGSCEIFMVGLDGCLIRGW
jgi:hypothetical protein